MSRAIVALVFRCDHDQASPQVSDEVTETLWMNRDDLGEYLDPAFAWRLLDAFNADGIAVRSHDGVNLLPF